VAQKQGRFDEAVSLYRKMLETMPGEGRVHHNLALALWSSGRADEARQAARRSAELGLPLPPQVRAQLGL
jgi:Flp pilus assembly protein TadD